MQSLDRSLYHEVRAALVASGTSLNAWCLQKGIARQYAEAVLRGNRNGQKAQELKARIASEVLDNEISL